MINSFRFRPSGEGINYRGSFFEEALNELFAPNELERTMETIKFRATVINHFAFRMKIIFDIRKEMTVIHSGEFPASYRAQLIFRSIYNSLNFLLPPSEIRMKLLHLLNGKWFVTNPISKGNTYDCCRKHKILFCEWAVRGRFDNIYWQCNFLISQFKLSAGLQLTRIFSNAKFRRIGFLRRSLH